MDNQPIEIRKCAFSRLQDDLKDPVFLEDLKHAKNILIVVQREGNGKNNQGISTELIYASDDMPNLIYVLETAKHMILNVGNNG